MKKVTFLLFGIVLSASVVAQTPVTHEKKKEEMTDLKKDVKEKRVERKEMGHALAHAKFKKAVAERKDVRAENRDIKKDGKRLGRHGVKHPVTKTKHKIRAEKEEQKAKF